MNAAMDCRPHNMNSKLHFQGFFSYSHIDAEVDPDIIEAFSSQLERRVTAKLLNAEFRVWRDVEQLRTGQLWDERIAAAIRDSSVFILLLTPKWLESGYCRKEYEAFCSYEGEIGEYVAQIVVRDIERQRIHFTDDQNKLFSSLEKRQYTKKFAADFLIATQNERTLLVDGVADDVVGMIERVRGLPSQRTNLEMPQLQKVAEFNAKAHDFNSVDFVSGAEVLVQSASTGGVRSVFACVQFLPRMYVQSQYARIEFSIRRALLTMSDNGHNGLAKSDALLNLSGRSNAYYVTVHNSQQAVTVCIDPLRGKRTLEELPLTPAVGENRLAVIATVASDAAIEDLRAKLTVSLSPEGLYVYGSDEMSHPSTALMNKIAAIIGVAAVKEASAKRGLIEREIPIRERRQ